MRTALQTSTRMLQCIAGVGVGVGVGGARVRHGGVPHSRHANHASHHVTAAQHAAFHLQHVPLSPTILVSCPPPPPIFLAWNPFEHARAVALSLSVCPSLPIRILPSITPPRLLPNMTWAPKKRQFAIPIMPHSLNYTFFFLGLDYASFSYTMSLLPDLTVFFFLFPHRSRHIASQRVDFSRRKAYRNVQEDEKRAWFE